MKKINIEDFIGKKYNHLTIIEYAGETGGYHKLVNVLCECGQIKKVRLYAVLNDEIKSCGCTQHDHSIAHNLSKHPLYKVWRSMNLRCNNPDDKDYGGRDVSVSIRWKDDFKAFYDWAIDKWEAGLQLDKDIRSGGRTGDFYCPELCCFVTKSKNLRNKTDNYIIAYKGESKCLIEWAEILNMPYSALYLRIKRRKWDIERAFTEPIEKRYSNSICR